MSTTAEILDQLNSYNGENIWEDVIYGLDYDEAATNALAGPDDSHVVIGGVHYWYDPARAEWRS